MSTSGWWFIKLENVFDLPDPEPPVLIFCTDDWEYMDNLSNELAYVYLPYHQS